MKVRLATSVLVVALAMGLSGSHGQALGAAIPTFNVANLGTLGGSESRGFAINEAGDVVGNSTLAGTIRMVRGFRYHDGVMTNLGLPEGLSGHSLANDINESGLIVGTATELSGRHSVFLWAPPLGPAFVPGPFPTALDSTGDAINDSNVVAGSVTVPDPSDPNSVIRIAMTYALGDDVYTDITGGFGGIDSVATDLTEQNLAVGAVIPDPFSVSLAFFHMPFFGTTLDTFGHGDAANAVNDLGDIVGSCGVSDSASHACSWPVTGVTDLGTLGGSISSANGINNKGEIVGSAQTDTGQFHAFVRTGGQMIDLNDLIPAASGWELVSANDININSQITGYGRLNGATRAFKLTPTTMPGTNVVATPFDQTTGTSPVTLTFDQITQGGVTTLTTGPSGPPPPHGFSLGSPAVYYELFTSVAYAGSIRICIDVTGISFGGAPNWHRLHGPPLRPPPPAPLPLRVRSVGRSAEHVRRRDQYDLRLGEFVVAVCGDARGTRQHRAPRRCDHA
jgi:probable HAF family extracellular repeat protein